MRQQGGALNDLFSEQVIAMLPKLRIQALALTRNKSAAEDLVQDTVCNALRARASFIPGTNFPAWMHRILRNRFISDLRKRRDTSDIANLPEAAFATEAAHEDPSVPMTMRHWPHASLDLGAGEQHRGYAQQSFAAERRS